MSKTVLEKLGIQATNQGACWGPDGWVSCSGEPLPSIDPATGEVLATVVQADEQAYETVVAKVSDEEWEFVTGSADLAAGAAQPRSDHRGTADYKKHIVQTFVTRILNRVASSTEKVA